MKTSALWVPLLMLLLAGCSKKDSSSAKPEDGSSGNPVTAPVDYLGAVGKAKKFSEKTIDAVSINQAIQLFYAQEDRFPKTLDELAAKQYIASVPAAPAGMRWEYNPQTGALKAIKAQ